MEMTAERTLPIARMWIWISYGVTVLMALVSLAGILLPSVYEKEHASWAAQGFGQDLVNVAVVLPVMLISLRYVKKGSLRAMLVWLGVVVYLAYSYVLYAFFMHFGPWFLVYVAVLGASFYTLVGSLMQLNKNPVKELCDNQFTRWPSVYLFVNGAMFFILWMMEIIPDLVNGATPKSAVDVGLWVNPVHVMDLAFILPGMLTAAVLLRRRTYNGYLLAVPLIMFAVVMGLAIVSMIAVMRARGLSDGVGPLPLMAVNVAVGCYLVYRFLGQVKNT